MECRESLKVREFVLARLTGESAGDGAAALAAHLAACGSCAAAAVETEAVWRRLADDDGGDLAVTPAFEARTAAALAAATRRTSNVRPFRPRGVDSPLLKVAAVLMAGVAGFFLARASGGGALPGSIAFQPTPSPFRGGENVSLVANRTLDASRSALDLSGKPRLANVLYTPADAAGRVAVSFDVTTRYTVVGKPEDQAVANLLVSLVSGSAGSEGAKGGALDLVSEGTRGGAPVSPEVVALLRRTLETDKNPGVRKKAAEALAQMPPSPETRDALAKALKTDTNPAVRILAVEGLAKAAAVFKDASSIESLRQKAADDHENGYVRSQAALALSKIEI
jgi:hypothetical protein